MPPRKPLTGPIHTDHLPTTLRVSIPGAFLAVLDQREYLTDPAADPAYRDLARTVFAASQRATRLGTYRQPDLTYTQAGHLIDLAALEQSLSASEEGGRTTAEACAAVINRVLGQGILTIDHTALIEKRNPETAWCALLGPDGQERGRYFDDTRAQQALAAAARTAGATTTRPLRYIELTTPERAHHHRSI